ncbi:hypothetical protein ZIOFF_062431 [Zingiber officinale]|uniref:DUF4378 domain-containing protein n=1 Tax=Zingiber officinale TaxID=94328 RepID=A0A8J5F4K8_ZINOF|nr:hypothetical protein ZIOFF_062431 [Zingiber officinale]
MAPKTRSFLHFLEWSRTSQKKLFPDEQASIGNSICLLLRGKTAFLILLSFFFAEDKSQDKIDGHDDKPVPNVPLIDEDEKSGVSSVRDLNEHSSSSSSSSVVVEEGSRTKAPGVVAKLMGLESMPSSGIVLSDLHNIQDKPGQNQRNNSSYVILKAGANSRTLDLWSQKMPGSPIERFQVEALPPRLVKSISVTRHKLLSPVKNLGLDSVKISEPEVQKKTKSKVQPSKPSPSPSEICDSTKIIATPPKPLKALEFPGRRIQSVSLKSSRSQALCRRDISQNDKSLLSKDESLKSSPKGKNKSVSLAIQAKLNVQTRKGISPSTSNKFVSQEDNEFHSEKPLKFQSSNQTHTHNKGNSDADSHNVHRPNKQDYLVTKSKLGQRLSVSDTSEGNALSRDGSSRNKKLVKDCVRNKKGRNNMIKGSEVSRVAKDRSMPNYKKVVLVENNRSYCKRCDSVDNLPLDKQRKHIRHNVVVSDHSGWTNGNTTRDRDVVSFTFTSPLTKLHEYSPHYRNEGGKEGKKNGYRFCSYSGNSTDSDDKNFLPFNLNVKDGDHLGFILEQRLKELASMGGSPFCISVKDAGVVAHLSDSIDSASTSDAPGVAYTDYQSESFLLSFDDEVCSSASNSSVNNVWVPCKSDKLQEKKRIGSYCNIADQSEIEHQDQSPLSIPDNSFSNESCSSESYQNSDGTRTNPSHYSSLSKEAEFDSMYKTGPAEYEVELSTSSLHKQAIDSDEDLASEIGRIDNAYTCWDELDYVKEILNSWEIISDDSILSYMDQSSEILDPHLFEKLEENQISGHVDETQIMKRKIIFDAVNECLSTKCSVYFQAGFQMWAKGVMFVRKDLSEELYNEISGCVCGEDWMVDELVYKDMSAHLGRWIDFEIEAFEAGVEIERWLLDTLVDEFFKEF